MADYGLVASGGKLTLPLYDNSSPKPFEPVEFCPGKNPSPEDDGTILNAITAFVAALPPPRARTTSRNGAEVFRKIRCDACHTPSVRLGQRRVRLYSDLLLHDVGAELNDSIAQGEARGSEWRTTPLWGLGGRMRLLHDGRSHNITEAILAHGGEARVVRQRFEALTPEDRSALLEFLKGL